MNILIIGGNGTIGKSVTAHFKKNHHVLVAGRSSGDYIVDITDSKSIENLFAKTKDLDAVVCIAGEAKWAPFKELTEDDFHIGLNNKLMGQVNLVRIGKDFIKPNASFTLTTGILADHPVPMTSSAAMVNGAIHSFVKAVYKELEAGIRINAVSCSLVEDAADKYRDYFPGHHIIPMNKVADAYVQSVEGKISGEIIRVYE